MKHVYFNCSMFIVMLVLSTFSGFSCAATHGIEATIEDDVTNGGYIVSSGTIESGGSARTVGTSISGTMWDAIYTFKLPGLSPEVFDFICTIFQEMGSAPVSDLVGLRVSSSNVVTLADYQASSTVLVEGFLDPAIHNTGDEVSTGTDVSALNNWLVSNYVPGHYAVIAVRAQSTPGGNENRWLITDRKNGIAPRLIMHRETARQPSPADGEEDIPLETSLRWDTMLKDGVTNPDVTKHYLYFVEEEPNFAGVSPIEIADISDPIETAAPITLKAYKKYFWRVDESINNSGPNDPETIVGEVWTFSMIDCLVDMKDFAFFAKAWLKPCDKSNRTVSINQFGAVADANTLNTFSIQKAIDHCSKMGGGTVLVPNGSWLTGTLFLKSNVELHLEEDAVLIGSPYMKDYPAQVEATKSRYRDYLQYALLFAQRETNIKVTGQGMLYGNNTFAGHEFSGPVVQRPMLLWFDECEQVKVSGITMAASGAWTQTYTRCRNVHVDGITVKDSWFANNDGCNIIDCENFLVENSDINALDDAICMKAYGTEGCKNVVIRNNRIRSLCNGIKAGTDSSGGFQNILIEDNHIYDTGISGIALELVDGGIMQNVTIRRITMDKVGTPIFIKLGERNRRVYIGEDYIIPETGTLKDIYISDITAIVDLPERLEEEKHHYNHPYASSITGIPGHYIERVQIENVNITIRGGFPIRTETDAERSIPENSTGYPENQMFGILSAYGFYCRHVKDLRMKNISINILQEDGRPAFHLDDVHQSLFSNIHTTSISQTPAFYQQNSSGIVMDGIVTE